MECQENRDFVTFRPSISTGWELFVPVEADTPGSLLEETCTVLEGIDATSHFFSPTGFEYSAHVGGDVSEVVELTNLEGGKAGRVDSSDDESLSLMVAELHNRLEALETTVWLSNVRFDRGWTNIRLVDGDHRIDMNSTRYKRTSDGEPTDRNPTREPLTISVFVNIDRTPQQYEVVVWTHTDIWFEDTDIGAINRTRLGDALERLRDELGATEFGLYSDSYSARWLRKQGFDDIVPEK